MYISRRTGTRITELQHVEESVVDILTTRKKTRILLGEYGCDIYDYVDSPINSDLVMDIRMSILTALDAWEPRLVVNHVGMDLSNWSNGELIIDLRCTYKPTGKPVSFNSLALRYRSIST